MLNEIVPWLIAIIGVLIGALGFKSRSKAREIERQMKTLDKAQKVRNEVGSLSDDDVLDRATKWVRNK